MEVSLRLKRANTPETLRAFDVNRHVPEHSAAAAVALFVLDVLTLSEGPEDAEASSIARAKLAELLLSTQKVMLSALEGGVACSLRAAAFSAWLVHLLPPSKPDSEHAIAEEVLQWAADHCLHGNVGEAPWSLTDLMFALETLACYWEPLCAEVWTLGGQSAFCDPKSPLSLYLDYLWRQCRVFVVEHQAAMAVSAHTLPYAAEKQGELHQVSVSPSTVISMCEIWRNVEASRRMRWSLSAYTPRDNDTVTFLNFVSFEKNQLQVDKFRENLRERFAHRVLVMGDKEIWSAKHGGKDVVVDLVVGARCPLSTPGFLQAAASAWTWEQFHAVPWLRDELYRSMADSAFRTASQVDFSSRFYEDAGVPVGVAPRRRVCVVKRICHGFTVVRCDDAGNRTAVTPPLPFAEAFAQWARRASRDRTQHYGPQVLTMTDSFV